MGTENKQMAARWEGAGGMSEIGVQTFTDKRSESQG